MDYIYLPSSSSSSSSSVSSLSSNLSPLAPPFTVERSNNPNSKLNSNQNPDSVWPNYHHLPLKKLQKGNGEDVLLPEMSIQTTDGTVDQNKHATVPTAATSVGAATSERNNTHNMIQTIKKVLDENLECSEDLSSELYKNLWLEAEAELCTSSSRARFHRAKKEIMGKSKASGSSAKGEKIGTPVMLGNRPSSVIQVSSRSNIILPKSSVESGILKSLSDGLKSKLATDSRNGLEVVLINSINQKTYPVKLVKSTDGKYCLSRTNAFMDECNLQKGHEVKFSFPDQQVADEPIHVSFGILPSNVEF